MHIHIIATSIIVYLSEIGTARIVDVAPANCSQHYKNRSPFAKLQVSSKSECSQYCDKLDNCRSFQVQTKQLQCTLLKSKLGPDAHHLMPKRGWTYKEKIGISRLDGCIRKAPQCKAAIKSFDQVEIIAERGGTWGWWGRDFAKTESEDPRYFWMDGYSNVQRLYYYGSLAAAWADTDRLYFDLPFGCDGMQNLIYDGKIWCRNYNDRIINVFDFDNFKMSAQIDMSNVDGYEPGSGGQCFYNHGNTRSDMDMEADETGVYVIWARHTENCQTSISKINTTTYTIFRTFHTSFPKTSLANTFMVCGRLWGIDGYDTNPAYLLMAFDTRSWNLTEYTSNYFNDYIYFPNEYDKLSFANYNPTDGLIYVYNNIRFGRKRPIFVDQGVEDGYWRNT